MSDQQNPEQPEKPEKPEKPEIRYVPVEFMPHMHGDEDEIDLKELIRTIWDGRKYIYYSVGIFVVFGLFVAFGSGEEFTSEVKLMPEARQTSGLGGLGGLAQQFGIRPGAQQQAEGIPVDLYPEITRSTVLMQRLLDYEVNIPELGNRATLYEYFTEHMSSTATSTVQRYTIRLPFTIYGGIRGLFDSETDTGMEPTELDRELAAGEQLRTIIRMSRDEWEVIRTLRKRITVNIGRETGAVTVRVKMPDPEIAADVADQVVQFLTEYITNNRTEKARQDLEFIEQRYEDARERFEAAQERIAQFNDENRGQLTAMARTQQQRLQSEYDLTFNLYNSMAERLEDARIKVQDETPVVNVLEPAAVPDRRSEPNRVLILIISMMLGGMIGVGVVFGKEFLANFNT